MNTVEENAKRRLETLEKDWAEALEYATSQATRFTLWVSKPDRFDTPLIAVDSVFALAPKSHYVWYAGDSLIRELKHSYRIAGKYPNYPDAESAAFEHIKLLAKFYAKGDEENSASIAYVSDEIWNNIYEGEQ